MDWGFLFWFIVDILSKVWGPFLALDVRLSELDSVWWLRTLFSKYQPWCLGSQEDSIVYQSEHWFLEVRGCGFYFRYRHPLAVWLLSIAYPIRAFISSSVKWSFVIFIGWRKYSWKSWIQCSFHPVLARSFLHAGFISLSFAFFPNSQVKKILYMITDH